MPRTDTLRVDHAEYPYRSLTIGEAEAFLQRLAAAGDNEAQLTALWRDFVALGLSVDPDQPWTAQDVVDRLDLVVLTQLRAALLVFSGLKVLTAEETASPGEPAASETSHTSEAA